MARDISIAITAKDNFSGTITTMRGTTQAFNKDLDALSEKINSVNKKKVTIKTDTAKAIKELEKLETKFAETRKASDEFKLSLKNVDYSNISSNITAAIVDVNGNVLKAEKSINNFNTTTSKMGNKAVSSMGSFLKGFDGGSKLLIDTASKGATTYMTSALGSEGGTLFSNSLSMGISGAEIGLAAGGPMGAAVGAAIGAGLGLLNGAIENYANEDEAFKSYVKNQYEGIVQERSNMVTNASSIAASLNSTGESNSFVEATKALNDMNQKNAVEIGDEYNKARTGNSNENDGDLTDQIAFYNSETGAAITEIDKEYAELMAQLENKKSMYQMDAERALIEGGDLPDYFSGDSKNRMKEMQQEFDDLKESDPAYAAKKKALLDESREIATNEYSDDEDVKAVKSTDEELITNLQKSAKNSDEGWQGVRIIEQLLSKGRISVDPGVPMSQFYPPNGGYGNPYPSKDQAVKSPSKPHAYGLSYVPYNNFPAMLHEGERVLTASENRNYRSGTGITITGNNFTVREEADINKIAKALSREIEKARMVMAV